MKNGDLSSKVVHPAGLEPTTYCSGGSRSIQMSYGCNNKTDFFNIMRRREKSIPNPKKAEQFISPDEFGKRKHNTRKGDR